MRHIILTAATLLTLTGAAHAASEAVAVGDLPKPVTAAVQEHFPGATIRSALRSVEKGHTDEFDLDLSYKALFLEVELSPTGQILDLDLKKR